MVNLTNTKKNQNYFIGVDVSKAKLDICILENQNPHYYQIKNIKDEIVAFFSKYTDTKLCVFEPTNTYDHILQSVLSELNVNFKKVDAYKFSYYLRSMTHSKFDAQDAYYLASYASKFYNELGISEFNKNDVLLKTHISALKTLTKINTQIKNFNHSLETIECYGLNNNFTNIAQMLDIEKQKVEKRLLSYVEQIVPNVKEIIKNEIGLGAKFAMYVFPILYITRKNSQAQVASYLGLSPRTYESGSSIKKTSIMFSSVGQVRSIIFLSAMSAARFNDRYRVVYQRLLSKGKSKRLATIAVARRLIRHIRTKYFTQEHLC